MKILYLLFSFTTGGTEHLVSDICNEMVKRNNDVHLYIVNDLYDESMLRLLNHKVQVFLQKRRVGSLDKLSAVWQLTKYIRRNKIEVVHCNALMTPQLLLLKPLLFRKVKVVHTVHGVGQYEHLKKWDIALRNKLCDNIIAISKAVQKDIIQAGADPSKVILVYNAIDVGKFNPETERKFKPNRVVIGNVARFVPEKKGQNILLKAVALLQKKYPDIQCYFAGGPDIDHQSAFIQFKNEVHSLKLDQNIHLLGNIEDVTAFLKKIDIFVLPSQSEGFGISLVEAMAMEIPCIASNLYGPVEVLENGKRGILFEVENITELTKKIDIMIKNYPEYKKIAKENRLYVQQRFGIKTMTDKLIAIYK